MQAQFGYLRPKSENKLNSNWASKSSIGPNMARPNSVPMLAGASKHKLGHEGIAHQL